MSTKARIHIEVDKERMKDVVTVNEIIGLQEGKLKDIRGVLSKFVWDDEKNEWMSEEDGLALIGGLTIRQLEEYGKAFMQKAEGSAVPPESSRT